MKGREPSDVELLGTLQREPETVGLVYDRYALRLVRYLQECGASEEAAMDATQEVFARLIVHHRRVRPGADGSVWPWLAVTGRNLVRDWQRRGTVEARARQRLRLPVPADEAAEALVRVEATRFGGKLRLALDRLTPEQRSAVTARVLDEDDYMQIAEAAGASEQTIRRRVAPGLRAMRTFLEGGSS